MAAKALKPVIAAFVLAVALAAYYFSVKEGQPTGYIETSGVMEAAEAELASKIAGRIGWLCCVEGDRLEAGAVAIRLDSAELQARLLEGRAAAVAAAEAIAEAEIAAENAKVEREAAASSADAAKAEADRSVALEKESSENFRRSQSLFNGGYIAKRDLDASRAAYESNLALLNSARARVRSAEANFKSAGVAIKAARAGIAAARARSEAAEAQVQVLASQLQDTEIFSPVAGIVSYKAFELGEYVTPGAAIYTVYAPEDQWARVDVEETRIQNIRLGSRAVMTPAGGGRAFEGRVIEIGELGGFATQRDVTRGRPDIKTFRVKVRAGDKEGFLKPGMTVNVRIFLNEGQDVGDRDYGPR
jgi:HlyD family secretion protein